jgi:hypothetical protein
MQQTVRVERVGSTPIAVVKRRARPAQLSAVVPEACGVVWAALKALGMRGAGRHVAVYRACGGGEVEAEVGVEVPAPVGRHGEVYDSATHAGDIATITHFGPYRLLGDASAAIRAWCAANGRTPAGPSWEIYGHWLPEWNDDPSQIRTDVYYLLKP